MSKNQTRKFAEVGNQEETAETAEPAVAAEPSQSQLELAKARELIEPMAKAGKSEDEMAVTLIHNGGFPFKKAGRLLRRVLEDLGVRMSSKDRLAQASELLLKNDFAPADWSEVIKVCQYLSQELDATDEKQALVVVKKFAKNQKIELPTKPKRSSVATRVSFRNKFLAWLEANPVSTDAQFDSWVKEQGKKVGQAIFYKKILYIVRGANAA